MANIYLSDEAKELLEIVSKEDNRTQDGEILHLLKKRKQELDAEAAHHAVTGE